MLFGNETISEYTRTNVAIWMMMAFQAGLINIGGFMACHRFVSHVTGFATFFGYEINDANYKYAYGMLLVPVFFLLGCMLSAQLVDLRLKRHKRPKYYLAFGLIFFILLGVLTAGLFGYFGAFGEPFRHLRDYVLLASLCLVCGLQNATVTSVSRSVIRTTHLTGITTDLGIGLMRWLFLNEPELREEVVKEKKANLMRTGIILFFVFGSMAGGFVFTKWHYGGFAIPVLTSGGLFLLMYYFQVYRFRARA